MATILETLLDKHKQAKERSNVVSLLIRYITSLNDDILTVNDPLIMSISRDAIMDVIGDLDKLRHQYEEASKLPEKDLRALLGEPAEAKPQPKVITPRRKASAQPTLSPVPKPRR